MLILVAAALAATPPAPQTVAPASQARAMVRILQGTELRFAELEETDPKLFRESTLRSTNGATEPAKLIEFQ